jgi:methylated-DNA-[protein]-cysteine S-methyltransferase
MDDLRRYASGEEVDFAAVVLDLAGTGPFDRAIYAAARAVGWGCTTTYGELARHAGAFAPEAAREVGQAMARNPVPIVIPCHRVLGSGNRIGGFSAPGGRPAKERLLALEGVRLDGGQLALPGV